MPGRPITLQLMWHGEFIILGLNNEETMINIFYMMKKHLILPGIMDYKLCKNKFFVVSF
jgi:hypothetical protein